VEPLPPPPHAYTQGADSAAQNSPVCKQPPPSLLSHALKHLALALART
jgi:hypothetical protein